MSRVRPYTKSAGYGQWGVCNKDAVLPTVISTGANRVSYTTTLPMIESGDMGKAVEVWQKIVGTAEDGEFGPKTKAATIAFQQRYSLEVDGIAGPESWGAGLKVLK